MFLVSSLSLLALVSAMPQFPINGRPKISLKKIAAVPIPKPPVLDEVKTNTFVENKNIAHAVRNSTVSAIIKFIFCLRISCF